MNNYSHMLSPFTVGNVRFKNRVLASPVTTNRVVKDGIPTPEAIDVYETKARGGFAQVTLTESFVDFEYAARHKHGLDLVSPDLTTYHMESVAILCEGIKAHGAVASIQLNHAGCVNHPDMIAGHKNPIGPSAFVRSDNIQIEEMNEDLIYETAQHFANACGSAKALGFDMVMLHGGHGWLLSQFLSPLTNKRKDKWGGSLENRARFTCTVLDAVRKEVGRGFPIEFRISGAERVPGGMELPETVEFCRIIEDKVDMIHVTSGIYHTHVETKSFSSMFEPHGCNLDLAEGVKKAVKVPVVAVGGFNGPEQIEEAIASGKCDFVAMGRQQFADPEFVNKTILGREKEIAPCLRCSCFNPLPPDPDARVTAQPWHCTVNPLANRELRWRQAPQPRGSRNVLVIGGGAAGLYAAATAAGRGHKVTLLEKSSTLGGVLWFTDTDLHKESLRRFRDSLIARCEAEGVELLLATEATPETVRSMKPDAIICAVGGKPVTPPVPGIEKAHYALYAYEAPQNLGKKIVMIGGGLVGCETAYHLAESGYEVHILEMKDDIASEANDSHRRALIPRMKKCLTWNCGVRVQEITDDGVVFADGSGNRQMITADTVLYAAGLAPRQDVVERLRTESGCGWFVPVGDCVRPRLIKQATYEGFCAAMDIL